MANIYDVKISPPAGLSAELEVRVTVMRRDGKAFSREELAAIAAAYPASTVGARAVDDRAVARREAPAGVIRERATRRKERKAMRDASLSQPKIPRGRARVLLVERDEELRDAIVRGLRARGTGVDAFASPLDALAAVQAGQVWARAIIGLALPHMDGAILTEEILKLLPDLEVTFTTGGTAADVLCRAHALGTVIWKPVGLGPLCERFGSAPWHAGAVSHHPADATTEPG